MEIVQISTVMVEKIFLNILSGVISGIVLAAIFFFVREKIFSLPTLSGKWKFRSKTTRTTYNTFQDMELEWVALLCCEGPKIKGTAEKVHEESLKGERSYSAKARTRAELSGYIEKRIFSRDIVQLHIIEHGSERDSTTVHKMSVENKGGRMHGCFSSTAADSEGEVTWQKDTSLD